mmetsp:Transcript_27392/g.45308  ORF Transcript_27392/g.45308 Transcript_27392/m.45308 type:complete len:195 (-) Transcript_27392:734-1318(-)
MMLCKTSNQYNLLLSGSIATTIGNKKCATAQQPRKRVVRFHDKETFSNTIDNRQAYKLKRMRMFIRRQIRRRENQALGEAAWSSQSWLTTQELKALHSEAADVVKRMERGCLNSNDDTCCLSKYSTRRRLHRIVVQKQLKDAIKAIQEYETQTGVKIPEIMAITCRKLTESMVNGAYLDGLRLYVEILQGKESS